MTVSPRAVELLTDDPGAPLPCVLVLITSFTREPQKMC